MAVKARHVGHSGTILDGRPSEGEVVETDLVPFELERTVEIAPPNVRRRVFEIVPRQIFESGAKRRSTGGLGPVVERKETVTCCDAGVYVLSRLEVVGVSPETLLPALCEGAPGCVVEDLLRAPACPLHLPDRLLGEDGCYSPSGGAQGPDVARGGEANPVAEARRRACSEWPRTHPGHEVAQGVHVGRAHRTEQERTAAAGAALPFEAGDDRRSWRGQDRNPRA